MLLIVSMSLGTNKACAQQLPNKISYTPTVFGYKMYQGNVQIGRERMRALMKECPGPLESFNTGNKVMAVSTLFELVSLVCLAGYASDRIFNDRINNELLIAGGAVFIAGIGLNISAKKQIGISLGKYNIKCLK